MEQIELDVIMAVRAVASRGGRANLSDIRNYLQGQYTRSEIDNALLALQDKDLAVLYRNDNPRSITKADEEAALDVGGFPRHLVYLDDRQLRKLKKTV